MATEASGPDHHVETEQKVKPPALAAGLMTALIAYEAIAHREARDRVRHAV